jgi:hypothetical protein
VQRQQKNVDEKLSREKRVVVISFSFAIFAPQPALVDRLILIEI